MSEIRKEIDKIAKRRALVSLVPFFGSKVAEKTDQAGAERVISAATGAPAIGARAVVSTPEEAAGYVRQMTGKGSITDVYTPYNVLTRAGKGVIRGSLVGATLGAASNIISSGSNDIVSDIEQGALKGAAIGGAVFGLGKPAVEYFKGRVKAAIEGAKAPANT